jgi:hypothetical protein
MSHDENMRNAAHIYDNLTPEDFGAPSDGHCDRCDTTTEWDDLRHVDSLDIYECKGCIAHGDADAIGETWRRACSDCGEHGGATKVTKEGWRVLCWECRQAEGVKLSHEIKALQYQLGLFLERRVEGANSDHS